MSSTLSFLSPCDLGPGADHLECHHVAPTGQLGDLAQLLWV